MAESTADDSLVLRDLVPPEPLLPRESLSYGAWVGIAVALLAVAALIFYILREKQPRKAEARRLREEAYARAVKSLEVVPHGGMQEAATRVSLALRGYLAAALGDRALFETHEEFVARHQALAQLPPEIRESTAEQFSHLARLKYGPDVNGDAIELFESARQWLERLHQHTPGERALSRHA